ncbi:hypothetical protein HYPSUDRAFT_239041 [Hypholoma sublateritium FD-334 SS-4]|uniref:Uncharacterized protein n=1 Tax=Hypholoma sublateritium (strain FD-334 SS-4) TaxID=945553 RepID=A0A0D2PG96_HYPSF|nr:hypothetical protein HYPSUDRAFT_239041 [Hypholoma sublateritium FD-334 SS-4]
MESLNDTVLRAQHRLACVARSTVESLIYHPGFWVCPMTYGRRTLTLLLFPRRSLSSDLDSGACVVLICSWPYNPSREGCDHFMIWHSIHVH